MMRTMRLFAEWGAQALQRISARVYAGLAAAILVVTIVSLVAKWMSQRSETVEVTPSPEPARSVATAPPPPPVATAPQPTPAPPEGMIYILGGTFQMGYNM